MKASSHRFSALSTDLYELTMACGYWKTGVSAHEAAFHVVFRHHPFDGQFTIACGLATAIEFLKEFHFAETEIEYLCAQHGNDGRPLFDRAFLAYLRGLRLNCDIDAVPEGTVVFPNEPMVRVTGPIIECQILETALLNILNFQSLIATKAARVCLAAGDDAVIEFGLRRAQGLDGGLSASRAAYIGGCAGTSNLLAGQQYGIPVSGTQAHSWIMFFETEAEAFQTYAAALPNNAVFLVDTYDSIEGVRQAVTTSKWLRAHGHEPIGVRLDSGDRVALSIEARRMLDAAGFPDAVIVCSGDLDEYAIADLKARGAKINVWGVGTKLATGCPDGALNGIYKLGAVRRPGEAWQYRIKLSNEAAKTSCPGLLQVRRYCNANGEFLGDAIYEVDHGVSDPCVVVDLTTKGRHEISGAADSIDLLVPIFRKGELTCQPSDVQESREHGRQQLAALPPATRQLESPQPYPVGLERSLDELRSALIAQNKKQSANAK